MTDVTYTPPLLACQVPASSKKQVLKELSDMVGAETGICLRSILSALVYHEKLGTTAMATASPCPMQPLTSCSRRQPLSQASNSLLISIHLMAGKSTLSALSWARLKVRAAISARFALLPRP